MSWEEVKLGDLIHIKHGWAFKGEFFSDTGLLIVVTPGNFFEEGGFKYTKGKEKFYTDKFPDEYLLSKNDLVIAMTEQADGLLGSPALIPENNKFLHNQRIGLITVINENKVNKEFLYHLFFDKELRTNIGNSSTGTKVRHTSPKNIYKLSVKLPLLIIQEKIVKLISNYDNLIENNTKRIKLLEEVAEELYKEWFVRLRFPNYENTKIINGIPDEWKEKNLFDICDVVYGYPLQSCLFNDENIGEPLIRIRDIKDNCIKTFTTERIKDEKYYLKNGDFIVGMDGDFHIGKWSGGKAILNQRVVCFRPNILMSKYFFYHSVKKEINYLNSVITGTTVAHLSDRDLRKINILIPPKEIMQKFIKLVDSFYEFEINLQLQNKNLKETRDLLLPRLLSGKLNIEDLEIV